MAVRERLGGVIRLLVLLWLVPALVACGGGLPVVGDGSLVTLETHGGMCADGNECRWVVEVRADGSIVQRVPQEMSLGRVPGPQLDALRAAIGATDFEALGSRPFTGTCPTAFDGQEAIWTFTIATGKVRLASCEVELDVDAPVFVAAQAALRFGEGPSN